MKMYFFISYHQAIFTPTYQLRFPISFQNFFLNSKCLSCFRISFSFMNFFHSSKFISHFRIFFSFKDFNGHLVWRIIIGFTYYYKIYSIAIYLVKAHLKKRYWICIWQKQNSKWIWCISDCLSFWMKQIYSVTSNIQYSTWNKKL